jgi:hypothetical protein
MMRQLAEKNSYDPASVRILTIITLIYLPCTVVSVSQSTFQRILLSVPRASTLHNLYRRKIYQMEGRVWSTRRTPGFFSLSPFI